MESSPPQPLGPAAQVAVQNGQHPSGLQMAAQGGLLAPFQQLQALCPQRMLMESREGDWSSRAVPTGRPSHAVQVKAESPPRENQGVELAVRL